MLNRRSFIRNSIFAAGTASFGVTEITHAAAGESTRRALLSDTHIPADRTEKCRGFSMIENLDMLLPGVAESRPDGIGITGDVARLTGKLEDYAVVKEYVDKLSQTAPVYMALGNHDNFKNFTDAFPSTAYNFSETVPVGWVDTTFTASGASLKLNAIAGNKADDGKVTGIKWRT